MGCRAMICRKIRVWVRPSRCRSIVISQSNSLAVLACPPARGATSRRAASSCNTAGGEDCRADMVDFKLLDETMRPSWAEHAFALRDSKIIKDPREVVGQGRCPQTTY